LPANVTKSALDLIQNHMHHPLVYCHEDDLCETVFAKMQKYGISQIPVMNKEGAFVGSIEDNHFYAELLKNSSLMNHEVNKIMQPPYPIVAFSESIEKLSSMINKQNSALLVMDMGGNWHIITKQDVIRAIAE
jgi:cystathionine beta-synthase